MTDSKRQRLEEIKKTIAIVLSEVSSDSIWFKKDSLWLIEEIEIAWENNKFLEKRVDWQSQAIQDLTNSITALKRIGGKYE